MSIVRYNRNLGKYVNKVIKSKEEKKIIDRTFSAFFTNEGVIYDFGQLRYITSGDNSIQRIGNSIDISSINFKGMLEHPAPDTNPEPYNCYSRIIVFQWHEDPFINFPAPKDIITYYTTAHPPPDAFYVSCYAAYNKENAGKFTILYDKSFVTSFYGPGAHKIKISLSKTIPNKTIQYTLNGTAPDYHPARDGIYMLLISDIEELDYAPAQLTWVSRTVYTDS